MNTLAAARLPAGARRHRSAPGVRIAPLAALVLSACLQAQAQETIIAYAVPAGTPGNQNFGGTLGMDFDVNNPILVKRLGVFDDNSDGLFLTITAKLWDRSDPANPVELVSMDFTPEDPGELVGGSRFKPLPEPVRLEIGFQGTIHAEGYGPDERLRNVLSDPANIVWTTHDGNGSIAFVGNSRYGTTPQWYPDVVDAGPAARYAAGIAYLNPEFQEGNQAFGGSLGMHFDVARPIQITRLGVYDEYGDGILFLPLHASVWNRQTREKLAEIEFTPESPGEPTGGSLFKSLPSPLVLAAGFQGTIVAHGYGAEERLFNTGNRPEDVALLATFDGGSLMFVGSSAYSAAAGAFPDVADGGPANRYAAGTFSFEPLAEQPILAINRDGDLVRITWTGSGTLEGAPSVTGSWTTVAGATSGMELAPTGAGQFFRVKQ